MPEKIARACVIGHPVAHSRSPMIHGYWLKTLGIAGAYELKDVAPEVFGDFLLHLSEHGYVGGNITVPHKEAAFELVTRRDAAAEAIGAVNTVWLEDGILVGANSDARGFLANLDERAPGWNVPGCRALILGAGGAARAAAYALVERGARIALVNRTLARAQALAAKFPGRASAHEPDGLHQLLTEADLLVNCTSAGMAGMASLDIDLRPLKPAAVVCDMVYVPLETGLLDAARARGHRIVDGLGMLLHQAVLGFEKWFGAKPRVTAELRALVEADIRAKSASA